MVVLLAGLACNAPRLGLSATPTPYPTLTPLPTHTPVPSPTSTASPQPEPTQTVSAEWETILPGYELRTMRFQPEGINFPVEAVLVRLDPALIDLRVHYDSVYPLTVSQWRGRTDAPLVINGGFFMPDNRALGLLFADGEPYGSSFDLHGGMLSVVEGQIGIRALSEFPYLPSETFDQAIQGRPMLLFPGGAPADFELSGDLSRRTAVGLDGAGRLLLMVINYGAVSLYDLRDWLAGEDELDLDIAFNLDGGGSTGLAIKTDQRSLVIDSWTPVPSVIAIYPKP